MTTTTTIDDEGDDGDDDNEGWRRVGGGGYYDYTPDVRKRKRRYSCPSSRDCSHVTMTSCTSCLTGCCRSAASVGPR